MEFSGITRHIYACPETFAPEYFRSLAGVLVRKSCPESQEGGKSSRQGLNGAGQSLEEPCCSELEQRNVTSLNVHPICCSHVGWSIPPPHHHHHPPHPQQQSNSGASEANKSTDSCSFSFPQTFSTHPDTSCSLSAPPSFGGVSCFALLLPHGAAHADPRREGETERLLCAEDRLCLWKITFSRKSCKVGRGKKKKKVCLPGAFPSFFLFKCGGTNWITLLTCHIATDGPSK